MPHCLPMKEQMKDQSISYVDLLWMDPISARSDDEQKVQDLGGWHDKNQVERKK